MSTSVGNAVSVTSRYLNCAGRELHFMDWGSAGATPVVAWHGLARTGRDFTRYKPSTVLRRIAREGRAGFYEGEVADGQTTVVAGKDCDRTRPESTSRRKPSQERGSQPADTKARPEA